MDTEIDCKIGASGRPVGKDLAKFERIREGHS